MGPTAPSGRAPSARSTLEGGDDRSRPTLGRGPGDRKAEPRGATERIHGGRGTAERPHIAQPVLTRQIRVPREGTRRRALRPLHPWHRDARRGRAHRRRPRDPPIGGGRAAPGTACRARRVAADHRVHARHPADRDGTGRYASAFRSCASMLSVPLGRPGRDGPGRANRRELRALHQAPRPHGDPALHRAARRRPARHASARARESVSIADPAGLDLLQGPPGGTRVARRAGRAPGHRAAPAATGAHRRGEAGDGRGRARRRDPPGVDGALHTTG